MAFCTNWISSSAPLETWADAIPAEEFDKLIPLMDRMEPDETRGALND
jgi:hypothetical protein